MNTLIFQVLVVVEKDGDGYYGHCPDLDAIHVYGDTPRDALDAAKDAIQAYFAMSIKHGDPIPVNPARSQPKQKDVKMLPAAASPPARQEFLENVELAPV